MAVLSVFLDEVILLFHRGEPEVDLLVGVLNLVVSVIEFVIFDLQRHELLLHREVVVQLLLQLRDLDLLSRDHRALIEYLLLYCLLVILKVYRFRLVPCDHLPKLAAAMVVQEE